MAEMFLRSAGNENQYGCYSERGLMSYLMFVCLHKPGELSRFLKQFQFDGDAPEQFTSIAENPKEVILFSELDFGNEGFGSPDGAIYIHHPQPTMIFIETKLNESYNKSCRSNRGDNFNSSIQGQLELRWRLSHLHFQNSHKLYDDNQYLTETTELKDVYQGHDRFYHNENRNDPRQHRSWRRLKIQDGVAYFLSKLKVCDGRVYFCAITNENEKGYQNLNPFKNPKNTNRLPRCGGMNWDKIKYQFCWMSAKTLIEFTKQENAFPND